MSVTWMKFVGLFSCFSGDQIEKTNTQVSFFRPNCALHHPLSLPEFPNIYCAPGLEPSVFVFLSCTYSIEVDNLQFSTPTVASCFFLVFLIVQSCHLPSANCKASDALRNFEQLLAADHQGEEADWSFAPTVGDVSYTAPGREFPWEFLG